MVTTFSSSFKRDTNKNQLFLLLLPLKVAVIGLFLSSPVKATSLYQSETTNNVILWNNVALQAVRDTRMGPPMTARALSMVQTGIYDAWAAYDPLAVGTIVGNDLQRPDFENTLENKNKAISYAAYRTLSDLFPSQVTKFNNVMTSLGYDFTDTSTDTTNAIGIGNLSAQALLGFRHNDGSNQLGNLSSSGLAYSDYTGYTSVNDPLNINNPDRWQPLQVSNGKGGFVVQKYLAPQWGNVTPFALQSGSELRPTTGPKTLVSDPEGYKAQAQEILDISANLTDEQKVIAEYWADGPASETPPGHWNLFAQFVSQRDNHDLDTDVKMFFALDNALLDASIVAWDAKRAFDSVRPVTAIHYLYQGQKVNAWGGPNQGTQEINGEDWQPYQATTFVTPPFPEYVSGHSTFSAAAAEILKRFSGSDAFDFSYTQPAGTSFVENGLLTDITLSWNTFSEAADQAGLSRRYGGIHFADGDLMGRSLGRQVGGLVWAKAQSYISPTSVPEPSVNLSLLALGVLGVGSWLKRVFQKNNLIINHNFIRG
ncbi:phosphatase PAP2 family protein [Anabaena cylindrica FACHB-243]|uniref:PEP motif putative anchor domain protein n=1 Tax=Anabaena cylindrica (strain ATCC 27899 / PCC 7122) TaxID=272123 RepID=K9ZMS6_ANACC|nr:MULTISPECIES: vanadium-dependent haloperoxidase [Anabaena]AFZ59842.1 PEP motif putative anchor domain protein [Anabaena cylindrica PCC 7122]MBD2417241.1 phosphatase PAP2 family protein [Anabaena cylindrica FACHB-243]MBY5282325.1 vanadium-dependent haloperoxidase [Anabaena sp. CCAP 1446/1C]MBY5309749.1 vanadium-dependent haloperoxidase [Anabaena sp. CCAP 1446/1C]MCM2404943.1 phosphatase PAP2 family protein [Anabaena sp. CCAP 1446/1C]